MTKFSDTTIDVLINLVFAGLTAMGFIAVYSGSRFLAWVVIGVVDIYMLAILVFAAIRSDNPKGVGNFIKFLFPRRAAACLTVLLLIGALTMGFAGLYVDSEVFASKKGPVEAIYISALTLGFSDFAPKDDYGRELTLIQLASGVVLFVGIVPLLISRLANFQSPISPAKPNGKLAVAPAVGPDGANVAGKG